MARQLSYPLLPLSSLTVPLCVVLSRLAVAVVRAAVWSDQFGCVGRPRVARRIASQSTARSNTHPLADRSLIGVVVPSVCLLPQSTFAYDEFVPLVSSSLLIAVILSSVLYVSSQQYTNDGPSTYLSTHGQTGNTMSVSHRTPPPHTLLARPQPHCAAL